MRVLVGTSGFSYKEWVGTFYPAKTKASDMLAYYASQLPVVELNNTFYRMPNAALVTGWAERVPDSFRFVLKAPRSITHIRRLVACDEPLKQFVGVAHLLGDKLGPLLFQLPPQFRKDVPRLTSFLALVPDSVRIAFEFRHASWADAEVYDALRAAKVALCPSDVDDAPPPELIPTAPFAYLRLRRSDYSDEEIGAWASRIRAHAPEEVYVFMKHELKAPELAAKLNVALASNGG
jgi:uncharacterized protein YecE (DUF72 family)